MAMFNPYQGGSSTPNWAGFDPNRVQGRIGYLQKIRPNDPEIGQWQKLMTDYNAYQSGNANPNGGTAQNNQQNGTGLFSAGNTFAQQAQNYYNKATDYFSNNQPNYNNAPALPGVNDFSADRSRIENAMYDRSKQNLDLQWDQNSKEFEQRMANQGVDIGTPKYAREKEAFEKARSQAYNDSQYQAMMGAGTEQSRMFNNALMARQQGVTEADNLTANRINQLAAVLNPAFEAQNSINNRYATDRTFDAAAAERDMRERLAATQNSWQGKQNDLDRAIKRSEVAKMGNNGGGAIDPAVLAKFFEIITGEKLDINNNGSNSNKGNKTAN